MPDFFFFWTDCIIMVLPATVCTDINTVTVCDVNFPIKIFEGYIIFDILQRKHIQLKVHESF